MSKYTTEIRFLQSMNFDFGMKDYPIFDETYRSALNAKILKHFKYREIGLETPGRFKDYLNQRLDEVMPLYNQMYASQLLTFNPMYDHDISETSTKDTNGNSDGTVSGAVASTGNTKSASTDASNSSAIAVNSDTPQGLITRPGLDSDIYASSANKSESDSTGSGTNNADTTSTSQDYTESKNNITNLEEYARHVSGNQGAKNFSELLLDFRETFLNIDMLVIHSLDDLFMGVY